MPRARKEPVIKKRPGAPKRRPPTEDVHLKIDAHLLGEFDLVFRNRTEAVEQAMRLFLDMAKARAGLPVTPPEQ